MITKYSPVYTDIKGQEKYVFHYIQTIDGVHFVSASGIGIGKLHQCENIYPFHNGKYDCVNGEFFTLGKFFTGGRYEV